MRTKEIVFSHEGGRRKLKIKKNGIPLAENRNSGPAGFAAARQEAAHMTMPTRDAAQKPGKYCVYNQTRERFVATDVEVADASLDGAEARLRTLEQSAGTGLWILPYQGISPTSIRFPMDLVFLDENCVVLATVESFPLASLPDSSANVGSVLTLPAATVVKGETRAGDQLIISDPEEMKQYLQRMKEAKPEAQIKNAPLRNAPVENAPIEPTSTKAEIASGGKAGTEERAASPPIDPGAWKKRLGTRSWFTNLLLGDPADPRAALREELPRLIAYYFTGGTPMAQEVRDISVTGMYIVTSERWYPGTVVRVTLTDRDHPTPERTLTVNAQAVRSGRDGVGLEFLLEKEEDVGTATTLRLERTLGVNDARVEAFLQELKKPPSQG
jgi:PilZ domain